MMLSEHFALEEFTASQTASRLGIANDPPPAVVNNLRTLARRLEAVRGLLGGRPLIISSGYRSPELNEAVNGSRNSAHLQGLAADFICPAYGTPQQILRALAGSQIIFDQAIEEFGSWVHFGLGEEGKREVLVARLDNGKVRYSTWTA